MKVVYQETYSNMGDDVCLMPTCPNCNEPTYSENVCPFCGINLEYKQENDK